MNKKIKILLVEDEQMLAEILSDTLSDRNFEVSLAYDGVQGFELASKMEFDVIVTDVMMPNMDGFTLVKKLRSNGCSAPVLFLTARSTTEDVVKGFKTGGNDYLKKPFAIDELIVRIQALACKNNLTAHGELHNPMQEKEYQIGIYIFNPHKNTLTPQNNLASHKIFSYNSPHLQPVKLAARESAVLLHLCRNIGNTVEASYLLKELWGDDNFFNLRSLNVYITRLRNHLKGDPSIEITSIRGVGYRLESESQFTTQ